jgi:hypothetical protein
MAIENALKVMQLVKENVRGINSCIKIALQFNRPREGLEGSGQSAGKK